MDRTTARGATIAIAFLLLVAVALVGLPPAGRAGASAPGGPDDPFWPQQWNLRQVGAPAAWTVSTGKGVRIGIVDTGVDLAHQDLAAKVVASANCIGADGVPSRCDASPGTAQDDNGHGTHVAGIAAAVTGNHVGMAGMAPGADLVVAKALDSSGSGTFADVNAGIEWVVAHGARVVNLSLGDNLPRLTGLAGGDSLGTGIDYAWAHGAVPVLASGNRTLLGPGTADYGSIPAVVVGATGRDGRVAPYSSPTGNAQWAVLAPGGNGYSRGRPDCSTPADQPDCILSTYWFAGQSDQYAYDEGTSMAVPEVSGTVALLLAMGRTPGQAVQAVLSTADHKVSCGRGSPTCAGLLDAAAAVGASRLTQAAATSPARAGPPASSPTTTRATMPASPPPTAARSAPPS
ncbi:MAG: S8 family serine peptidase, partial [Acidimicrobiales bacterium]